MKTKHIKLFEDWSDYIERETGEDVWAHEKKQEKINNSKYPEVAKKVLDGTVELEDVWDYMTPEGQNWVNAQEELEKEADMILKDPDPNSKYYNYYKWGGNALSMIMSELEKERGIEYPDYFFKNEFWADMIKVDPKFDFRF